MKYYFNPEKNHTVVYVKVNSGKAGEVVKRQVILLDKRVQEQIMCLKTELENVPIHFGYVDDDFPKNKYTLSLTYKH